MLTFSTNNTSIIGMSITEVNHANTSSKDWAVYKSTLITTTEQVIKPDGTSSLTKEGIRACNSTCKRKYHHWCILQVSTFIMCTKWCKSQLSASHISIRG